ncbi:hypothetical protein PENTCL1PPCAC_21679, partial [Pristionchus entomophagus]
QMTREKYSQSDLRIMVEFLYKACSSKDRKLQRHADVPKGLELWKLMEKEQGRTQQRFGVKCDHSASSMTTKYRKYLHEKMHHVDGVSAEKVLCIYKYVGTELPALERQNILKKFPNYHVVYDRSTGNKRKVISYQLKTRRTRTEEEEEEENDETNETELHVSRASDDDETDSQGSYRPNLNPVMRTPGGTRRIRRPSEPLGTRILNHVTIIRAHDPNENLTDTPMWRRPREPVDVAAIKAAAAAAAPAADPKRSTLQQVQPESAARAAEEEKNSRVTRSTARPERARLDLDESVMVIGEEDESAAAAASKERSGELHVEQTQPVKKKPSPWEKLLENMNRLDEAFMEPLLFDHSADDSIFEPHSPVVAAPRQ